MSQENFMAGKRTRKGEDDQEESKRSAKRGCTDKSRSCPFAAPQRRSWAASDRICAALGQPHANDTRSALDIVREAYGAEWSLDAKLAPPTVVCIKGRREKPNWDVYIGRALTQGGWNLKYDSVFANPCRPKQKLELKEIVRRFECYMRRHPDLLVRVSELAGQRLGCWCAPRPCHGDVLVRLFHELQTP